MIYPTPMIVALANQAKQRFYSAKLEGLTDQAAFEEIIRTILKTYDDATNNIKSAG